MRFFGYGGEMRRFFPNHFEVVPTFSENRWFFWGRDLEEWKGVAMGCVLGCVPLMIIVRSGEAFHRAGAG